MKFIIATRDIIYMVIGILLILATSAVAQEAVTTDLVQTVRGTLLDADTKAPLIGASVLITNSSPTLGTITDVEGNFRIRNVPVGRVSIQLNYLGYETRYIPNVVVNSGKEVVLNLSMQESLIKMEELVITSAKTMEIRSMKWLWSVPNRSLLKRWTDYRNTTIPTPQIRWATRLNSGSCQI